MATTEKHTPTLDPTLTLEQVTGRILELFAQGEAGNHQIGLLYNHVVEQKLAEKKGYKNARDYFSQHLKVLGQSTLSLYGTVAKTFTEQDATRYGMNNLGVLLTYAEATNLWLPDTGPGQVPIDVPLEDGSVTPKPFAECTVAELKLAVKHKRQPNAKSPLPAADDSRIQALRQHLTQRFSRSYGVKVEARVSRGKTFISLVNVPLEELDSLTEALMENASPPLRVAG
jgi:hypothetical protein